MARVKLDDNERMAFIKAYNKKCYQCKEKKESKDLEIDHIIPPNKRGEAINKQYINSQFDLDAYYNYACICRNCNSNKSDILLPNVSVFVEKAKQKLPQVQSELERLLKQEREDQEDQIIKIIRKWHKSGNLSTQKIHDELSNILYKSIKHEVTNITLRPESAIEIIDKKLINHNELDNLITKIQTSQEMVFGYSNTSCLFLEEGIQFYPLSIYLSYRGLDNRELLKQKQEELIFELTFYAILLKDNKAVLISIPNVNVGFKNLDYKEEIEPADQLSLFNIESPFYEKNTRQRYFYNASFLMKIRRKFMELTNASRIVMQYIWKLFKDVDE